MTREKKTERPAVIGARVRELQEARGWTQPELAWRANVNPSKIHRIVAERQDITAATLVRLARALGTSADYLLGFTDDKRPRSS